MVGGSCGGNRLSCRRVGSDCGARAPPVVRPPGWVKERRGSNTGGAPGVDVAARDRTFRHTWTGLFSLAQPWLPCLGILAWVVGWVLGGGYRCMVEAGVPIFNGASLIILSFDILQPGIRGLAEDASPHLAGLSASLFCGASSGLPATAPKTQLDFFPCLGS